jgi:hypothetical protein
MIDEQTTGTTAEICLLAGFTKQRLGQLESQGVVTRSGRDQWLLPATIRALIADARARADAHSASRARLDDLRASREKLKLMKESGEVCYMSEFIEAGDNLVYVVQNRLAPLPAQIGGRDVKLRQLVDAKLRDAQNLMSADMRKLADELDKGTGKASRRDSAGDRGSKACRQGYLRRGVW